ncbi:MAG: hypothetical protein LBC73_10015 [Oscillospiraceae bacterium]|nr:hypothetical protein [Oscillospiraceae bacterium]
MERIKKLQIVLITVILIFCLVSCANDGETNKDGNNHTPLITDKNYKLIEEIQLYDIHNPVNGAKSYNENIVFWYEEFSSGIKVVKLSPDGNVVQTVSIKMPDGFMQILELFITDTGEYEIIATVNKFNGTVAIIKGIYSQTGDEITTQILVNDISHFNNTTIDRALFTDDGNIALLIWNDEYSNILFLFNNYGELLGQFILNPNQCIVRLKDGRLAVSYMDGNISTLRIIDFSISSYGETLHLTVSNINRLFPTDDSQLYDLLVDDGNFLIGYILETGEQVRLINWMDAGFIKSEDWIIGFLFNDNIFLLNTMPLLNEGYLTWSSTLYLFSYTSDSDSTDAEQKVIITLGGIWFSDEIRREIINFNNENHEYKIEIRDYLDSGSMDAWIAGELRLYTDMITGRGPDIIIDTGHNLINHNYLVDLYSFIDDDSKLKRTDFFHSILQSLETPEGKLPLITNAFMIQTMLATNENAYKLDPLTFANLLQLLNEFDSLYLAGDYMSRELLIENAIFASDNSFINWDTKNAFIDTDAFINVLEIASRLPEKEDGIIYFDYSNISRLLSGRQLLHQYILMNPEEFHNLQAIAQGAIVSVGMPTLSGGQELVIPREGIGINIGSPHQEAAWSFIRRFLLPEGELNIGFPIRIDKYEELIDVLMTPNLWLEDVPEFGIVAGEERPREIILDGETINIYAMTVKEAAALREIIDMASIRVRSDRAVWAIVQEDIHAYFNGIRDAANTARIMQSRVQIYFDEQK